MKRTILIPILFFIISAFCMASGELESSSSGSSSSTGSGAITFMLSETDADRLGGAAFLENLAGTFTSRTGIEVDIEIVNTGEYQNVFKVRVAAGQMADVFTVPYNFGNLEDIIDSPDTENLSPLAGETDFLVQTARTGDGIKTLPYSMDVSGILYNTRMVDSVTGSGRRVLDDLVQSWVDRGDRFFSGGQVGFPLQAYILFDLCLAAELLQEYPRWPEELAAGKVSFDFPKFTGVLRRAAGLFKGFPKDYLNMSQENAIAAFQRGDYPAIPAGTWNKDLLVDPEAPIRFEGFPVEGGKQILRVYPYTLAVYADSRNKTGALTFVEFLLSPEVQEALVREGTGVSPVRGVRYPEGALQNMSQTLENAAFLSNTGLSDMTQRGNLSFATITAFYKGLYRAAAGGGNLDPVSGELTYQYFKALGMDPPPVPESRAEPSGGSSSGGSNAPNSP